MTVRRTNLQRFFEFVESHPGTTRDDFLRENRDIRDWWTLRTLAVESGRIVIEKIPNPYVRGLSIETYTAVIQ